MDLSQKKKKKTRECSCWIVETEFWIVEEEEPGELDYNELENALAEEYPKDDEDKPRKSQRYFIILIELLIFIFMVYKLSNYFVCDF